MNTLEKKMIDLLFELKEDYGVVGLKAEFEAEASRRDELMRLKDILDKVDLEFVIKIGGAEAVTDMYDAVALGANVVVAPMIESAYALKKYLSVIDNSLAKDTRANMEFGINIETINAYENLDEMFRLINKKNLQFVTVGRVDMTGSLGIDRDQINSEKIFNITQDIFARARKKGLKTAMGGGIAKEALPFIEKLTSKLIDKFETRKVVFKVPEKFSKLKNGIIKANKFELLWLQNKKNYYGRIFNEDNDRIKMIQKRINH